jgi:transposase
MAEAFDARKPATAFDHDSTLVIALELSGKSWEIGAVVPGVSRRPKKRVDVRDMTSLLAAIARWKEEANQAGRSVTRIVLTYEAGRDGFWIARYLIEQGIETHVMHAASIPAPRQRRRAKTDRIDLDMLLRTLLAWLRGEPRACTMARVPSVAEEDGRRPHRERERLISERIALENRIDNILCLFGVAGFKPRLKKAAEKLEQLRGFDGAPLPDKTMGELRRLMARHRLLSEQIKAIEASRDEVAKIAEPDRIERMIQLLAGIYGLGLETASVLVREMLCRSFKDRRALASFAGLSGTPFNSGGSEREQGIGKNGNARVRLILMQLAWRWQKFQPGSPLTRWFAERTKGAKGRIRKIMIVAVARKLLIALWRFVETGLVPEGVRIAAI